MSFRFTPDVAEGAFAQQEESPEQRQMRYQSMGQRASRRAYERTSGYLRISQVGQQPRQQQQQQRFTPPPEPKPAATSVVAAPTPKDPNAVRPYTKQDAYDFFGIKGKVRDGGQTTAAIPPIERDPVYAREARIDPFRVTSSPLATDTGGVIPAGASVMTIGGVPVSLSAAGIARVRERGGI